MHEPMPMIAETARVRSCAGAFACVVICLLIRSTAVQSKLQPPQPALPAASAVLQSVSSMHQAAAAAHLLLPLFSSSTLS